MKISDKPEV